MIIGLALTALIISLLFSLIERNTERWLPLFRVLYSFYKSCPSTGFAKTSRYYLALFDRNTAQFIYTEALTGEYQNEEEHERAMDELKQRLRKKSEVSE